MKNNMYDNLVVKDYEKGSDLLFDFIKDVGKIVDKKDSPIDRISIYAKSDLIYILFRTLLNLGYYTIGAIHFNRYYFDEDYDKAYCLSVYDDKMMIIEPAYNDKNQPYMMDGIAYMYQEDCHQDLISMALQNDVRTILFSLEDQECEFIDEANCVELTVCVDDETDEIHGFEAKTEDDNGYYECSYFTTDVLTEEEVEELLDRLGM